MFYHQIVEVYQSNYQTMFLISIMLLMFGYRNTMLSISKQRRISIIMFIIFSFLTVSLPFSFQHPIWLIGILVSWSLIIAPMWSLISKRKKILVCLFSYPGTIFVLVGSWPSNLFPGILGLPFFMWWPAPFWSLKLRSIGNINGFESAFVTEMNSLLGWGVLVAILLLLGLYRKKANKPLRGTSP
jgi:hypothetical protein